jgi:hypothetical protein
MNETGQDGTKGKMILTLEVTDTVVFEYLKRFSDDERPQKALDALKVGVIAIQSASPSLDTRVVEEKFRQVEGEIDEKMAAFREDLRQRLEQYFRAEGGSVPLCIERHFGENGSVSRILESYFSSEKGKLCDILDGKVGPNSYLGRQIDPFNREGLQSRIEKAVEEILREGSGRILESFSLDDETSALSRLKRSLREEIEKLQKSTSEHYAEIRGLLEKEKGRLEEARRGTAKGRDFETALYDHLAAIARGLDDESENTSGAKGLVAYEKVGDYVVRLGETTRAPGKIIVFEAKKASGYTLKKTLEELDRAKKNRGADSGIFAFAKGTEPPEVDDFYRYGNDFIVTVDEEHLAEGSPLLFFDAAYRIARTLIVSRVREEEKQAIDADYIRSEIENIIGALRYASDIFTKVGTIRNSADAIEKDIEKLQGKIEEHLGNISAHLPS